MIIDAHRNLGETSWARADADDIVRDMDLAEVDVAVVSPMGRLLVVANSEGNDVIARAAYAYPGRLVGFASVNPWWGQDGVREVERAITKLGLRGLTLNPAMQGFPAHDPIVYPLIEASIRLHVPVYIHSGTPVFSLPLQILALGELYPDATIIMGHMGGADFYVDIPLAIGQTPNVYLETSLTCHVGYVDEAYAVVGGRRLLFGTAYPFSDTRAELLKIRQARASEEDRERILGGNLARLLRLEGMA